MKKYLTDKFSNILLEKFSQALADEEFCEKCMPQATRISMCFPVDAGKEPWKLSQFNSFKHHRQNWSVCRGKKCKFVLHFTCHKNCGKLVPVAASEYMRELELHRRAAVAGLAPKIVETSICNDGALYITEAADMNLGRLLALVSEPQQWRQIFAQLYELLESLHSIGIVHGDINTQTVISKATDLSKEYKLLLTDFARACRVSGRNCSTAVDWEKLLQMYSHINKVLSALLAEEELPEHDRYFVQIPRRDIRALKIEVEAEAFRVRKLHSS